MKPLIIKVSYVHPPIPIRIFDWIAWVEGREGPDSSYTCHGETKENAVNDLRGEIEDELERKLEDTEIQIIEC